ncbi:hypothetical protein LJC63_07595 [Ruminococcaceae bacterium OttesenSCG-928-L11]|nr:hypothetical protein [Ruminococcaceae bacterium OttesenSCG-928-L11]
MQELYFVSQGKLCRLDKGAVRQLPSSTIEGYIRTVKDINKRREWKSSGTGAMFMGVAMGQRANDEIVTQVEAVAQAAADKLIYAATLETSCGLYTKNPQNPDEPEGYITRQNNMRFHSMDYLAGRLALSATEGAVEKHIALCNEDKPNFRFITEGESVDVFPSFSRRDSAVVYFSSAGFRRDREKGGIQYGNYVVNRFDTGTDEIDEILADERYDYLRPMEAEDGTLYCIRRTRRAKDDNRMTPLDVLLIPVKVLKGFFGWLNFFTQRYSGESLTKRSGGPNPSKTREQSEEDLFIEGNLIHVESTVKENAMRGEKYPGLAPHSWELITVRGGSVETLKKGVLDYTLHPDGGVAYSNGKYILHRNTAGEETVLCEAKVAKSLAIHEI